MTTHPHGVQIMGLISKYSKKGQKLTIFPIGPYICLIDNDENFKILHRKVQITKFLMMAYPYTTHTMANNSKNILTITENGKNAYNKI